MTDQSLQRMADKSQAPIVQEPVVQAGSLLQAIVQVAQNPALDVAKLDALMKMQFELEKRQAEREFIEAFARLSEKLPRIKKSGTIDLGKGRAIPFARFEDMDKVLRPLLASEGFTITFDSEERASGGLTITGHLERAGHKRTASIPLPLDQGPGRNNLQAVGSTLSYGKRYVMEMLVNLVREGDDDDGTKGGTRFASAEEVDELRALIEETTTNEEKFCGLFNVAHLAELPATSVIPAKNMLLAKKGRAS